VPGILDFAKLRLANDLQLSDNFVTGESHCKVPEGDCILRESRDPWARAARKQGGPCSLHDDNLHIPFAPQHVDAHVVGVAQQQQIDRAPSQFQVVNSQFAQQGR